MGLPRTQVEGVEEKGPAHRKGRKERYVTCVSMSAIHAWRVVDWSFCMQAVLRSACMLCPGCTCDRLPSVLLRTYSTACLAALLVLSIDDTLALHVGASDGGLEQLQRYVQILGTDAGDCCPSVLVVTEGARYLFNAGDGLQVCVQILYAFLSHACDSCESSFSRCIRKYAYASCVDLNDAN